jgi:hypothetical protein
LLSGALWRRIAGMPSETSNESVARLAFFARQRRGQLRLTQEQASANCGLSKRTLMQIEAGEASPSELTLGKLDVGLQWEPGSARTVLDGGEPVPIADLDIVVWIEAQPWQPDEKAAVRTVISVLQAKHRA